MNEERPFEDYAGLLRCPHCAALAVVIFTRTTHRYRRAQQTAPGVWVFDAEDPQDCEAGNGQFYACEMCRRVLGKPDTSVIRRLSALELRRRTAP